MTRTPPERGLLVALGAVVLLWLAVATTFARSQEIWIDEVTQLSGLTLDPVSVVPWLAGDHAMRFGVPGDRMPPLSYWLGWVFAQVFGLSETSLRGFGMLFTALGIVFSMRAAARLGGVLAAWLAGLALALSPALVTLGVEIRGYPLFFALASIALHFAVRILEEQEEATRASWIGLVTACVTAMYTHFYGLVLAGALFVALFPTILRKPELRKAYGISVAVLAVGSLGLAPFALASVGLSDTAANSPADIVRGVVRLVYRLLGGSPSTAVYVAFLGSAVLGSLVLLGVALGFGDTRAARSTRQLALGLGAGLVVVAAAKVVLRTFDGTAPHYNIWMVPFVAVIAATALAGPGRKVHWLALAGALLLVLGDVGGTAVLLRRPQAFAHSAAERTQARVEALGGPSRVVLVHDGTRSPGMVFFPLYFVYGDRLAQYVARTDEHGSLELVRVPGEQPVSTQELAQKDVLLLSTASVDTPVLSAFVRSGEVPTLMPPALPTAFGQLGYRARATSHWMALASTEGLYLSRP